MVYEIQTCFSTALKPMECPDAPGKTRACPKGTLQLPYGNNVVRGGLEGAAVVGGEWGEVQGGRCWQLCHTAAVSGCWRCSIGRGSSAG